MDVTVNVATIDPQRGDLFACWGEERDFVVQADAGVDRADTTTASPFAVGTLRLDSKGEPVALAIDGSSNFTSCHRMSFTLFCENDGAPCVFDEGVYVCGDCGRIHET